MVQRKYDLGILNIDVFWIHLRFGCLIRLLSRQLFFLFQDFMIHLSGGIILVLNHRTFQLLGEKMISEQFLYSCICSYALHVMKYLDVKKYFLYFYPFLIKGRIPTRFFPKLNQN